MDRWKDTNRNKINKEFTIVPKEERKTILPSYTLGHMTIKGNMEVKETTIPSKMYFHMMPTLSTFTHQEILILQHHMELHDTNQEKCPYCQQKKKEEEPIQENTDTEENPFTDTEYPHENM